MHFESSVALFETIGSMVNCSKNLYNMVYIANLAMLENSLGK